MNAAATTRYSSEVYRFPSVVPRDFMVSDISVWSDPAWRFSAITAGSKNAAFTWYTVNAGKHRLCDPEHEELLELSRRVMWSIRVASQRGRNPKDRTLADVFWALKSLLCWMMENDIDSFSGLNPDTCTAYLQHVSERVLARGMLTDYTMSAYADILLRIYEQSALFDQVPNASITLHPFRNRTTTDVALDYAPSARYGFIPSVPDVIYLATQATSQDWIANRADDVIFAQELMLRDRTKVDKTRSNSYSSYLNKSLARFEFTADSSGKPWRQPMSDKNALAELRGLFNDVRDACVLSLQGLLGLRISEVSGIQAGAFPDGAAWPSCVSLDRSITGLNEHFHLHGRVYKQRDEYEEVTWLAGSRPAGSSYIPPAVQAIAVLWRLMRPWREMSGRSSLIVGLGGSGGGFPWTGNTVTRVISEHLGRTQKSWVEANVFLPKEYRGWQLRTHQWRKSFAMYMVRSDARLLPAVRDHFKHMSIAMTERGYLGRDIEMLGLLDDEATYAAAQFLFEAVNGKPAAGKAMDTIEQNAGSILELIGDDGTEEERIFRLATLLKEDDVRVWRSDWGNCLFRAEVARCHFQAKNAFDLSARRPHYGQRRPGVCCDCANLLIFSGDTDFWQARFKSGMAVWEANRAAGEYAAAAVAEDRVRTSAVILKRLGIEVSVFLSATEVEDEDEVD